MNHGAASLARVPKRLPITVTAPHKRHVVTWLWRLAGAVAARTSPHTRCALGVGGCFGTMDNEELIIGTRYVWGGERHFGLPAALRRHHLYVVGKTGTGKTTLLRNLIVQDIEAGRGVGVLDPHGDLAEDLLDCIPPWRTDHVVYFNPADLAYPVGFNLLGNVPLDERPLVASGVVSIFKSIWRDSWGPRLEYILYNAVAALLDCENTTLLGLQRLLVDPRYRGWVVRQVKDPLVRSFWLDEFERYDKRLLQEAIAPVQNKVGQLLMGAPIRNILGQVRSRFDPRFMMDNGRILIANLAKGRIGEDKATLLGALLVSRFQLAALSRADVGEGKRRDFHLVIDEFHNFTTDAFASILSEARKYRLCLTLSHQYLDQLRPEVRDAVLGNAGSLVSFRVGNADAAVFAREFGTYGAGHFSDLANHRVCARLLSRDGLDEAFMGSTLPPSPATGGRRANVIRRSRERYARPRREVEAKLRRWVEAAS